MRPATKEQIAERIRTRRKELKLTQAQLGTMVGTGQSAVHGWETADFEPRDEVREKIADALDTTYESLFFTTATESVAAN